MTAERFFAVPGGCCIVWGAALICVLPVRLFEKTRWQSGRMERALLAVYGTAVSLLLTGIPNMGFPERVLLEILAGCLFFACQTDCRSCEVYQFTWWMAGGAAVCLLLCRELGKEGAGRISEGNVPAVVPLLVYLLLQEMLFARAYGKADCHAFAVCAIALCALGTDTVWYFLHMTGAFVLLIPVQALKRNIGGRGRLKRPVAFLPYITVSFWLVVTGFSIGY